MHTFSSAPTPMLTVIRWVARLGGLLFVVATAVNAVVVVAEMAGGSGPDWATLNASEIATIVLAFGLPFVMIAGVVIAWLRTGIGEGIGGALILVAALIALVNSLASPDGGGVSMALSSLPIALVGVGFLYCGWTTRRAHPSQAS